VTSGTIDDVGHSRLRVADIGFSAEQLAAARTAIAEQARVARVGLAVLSGSLAVGLGHTLSDVDVHIVYLGPPPVPAETEPDGPPVHIESLARESFVRLGAWGSEFRATALDRSQLYPAESDLKQLVRLATAHVVESDDTDPELAAQLPNRGVVRQILMSRNACDVAVATEDAVGAADIGDWYTALAASLSAVLYAAEAALAAADDVYYGHKFLFRRLSRTPATSDLVPGLWALTQAPATVTDADGWARELVERRLLAASHLLCWSLLDGWESPLDGIPAPPVREAAGPRRSPAYSPLRFTDGIALAGPFTGAEVSEGMLRVWRRLNGGALPDTLRNLARDEPGFGSVPDADLTAAVDMLCDYGAVEVESVTSGRR
jgi:hypothetical protein